MIKKTKPTIDSKRQPNIQSEKAKKTLLTQEPERKVHEWEDYFCYLSFKTKPINRTWLDKFALDWVAEAVNNEQRITIWHYPIQMRGIDKETVESWMKRHEPVKKAHRLVRALCASRRDNGAAMRQMDGSYIAKSMPLYCDDWKAMIKEVEEFKVELAKRLDGSANGPQIVVIEKYPETSVPKAKE